MRILGISSFFHDSAAALIDEGVLRSALALERATRRKHDNGFPLRAISEVLRASHIDTSQLDAVAFFERPQRKFLRFLLQMAQAAPFSWDAFSTSLPKWLGVQLQIERIIRDSLDYEGPIEMVGHHAAHAASAFFYSPFEEAAIMTLDGVGEEATATFGRGRGSRLQLDRQLRYPHSIGMLYAAVTGHLGFHVFDGEGTVMGLAPYGDPSTTRRLFDGVAELSADGSLRLDRKFFCFDRNTSRMTTPAFHKRFGAPRLPHEPLEDRHRDLAAGLQALTEEMFLALARTLHATTGSSRLCLAGGVAMNSKAAGVLQRQGPFEEVFIFPAPGDDGAAAGAAAIVHLRRGGGRPRPLEHTQLGPTMDRHRATGFLRRLNLPYIELEGDALLDEVVRRLLLGEIVGWAEGGSEFGPRALGGRSILADPRRADAKDRINHKVKKREAFRPFAASILAEMVPEWFETNDENRFMQRVQIVRPEKREAIPALVHVDGTCRYQGVRATGTPGNYRRLIEKFHAATGCPMLLNTSLNLKGQPIAQTPQDCVGVFQQSELDCLILGGAVLSRSKEPA